MEGELSNLEQMIVPLEAAVSGGRRTADNVRAEIAAARRMIVNMEKGSAADADYSARLTAWSGRLAILEGRYSEAQHLYRQSLALSPGNPPLIILSIRLEGDPAKRLEIGDRELAVIGPSSSGFGELNIERGRSLLELRRFAEAAGAFDTAFAARLDPVYRESYLADRNRAWELRNITDAGSAATVGILERGSLNWRDCLTITKNETQLFRFITGGRDINDTELFNRLLDRLFIPYTQDITLIEWPNTRPRLDDPVTRAGAAWFIWHLYAEARADRGLLSRYSNRFATGPNPRSPIADLPPLSPFFDSILGCVETELLSLPDGRNFRGSEPIRGAELLAILKKVDRD
jgi:tetratricopeptide (TPR) repeat protein